MSDKKATIGKKEKDHGKENRSADSATAENVASDQFHKTIVVKQDDLDELNHVNNVRYVQWIQDISKEHWTTQAPEAMREGVIWVVMHHDITYKNAAQLGDEIEVSTYIKKSRGAVSVRIVEMHDAKTGDLLVRSRTEWCLLNGRTQKPMRISEEIKGVFG